jgi:zona occludens toxin
MIYLTTGGNGAGKTLFTLADVRAQQLAENRPVYYHGFEALQPIKDFGWLPFDPLKWQDLPDGSICVFDECQNEFPAKVTGALPDYINAVAQFRRKRGFDFWMITPHPSMINTNIRRLIESPSWHRHMKRTMGADMVSELRFNFANINCEKPASGAAGQVSMRAFPREVYSWYKSASLHTGKKRIPKQVYILAALAVIIPALFYFAYQSVMGIGQRHAPATVSGGAVAAGAVLPSPGARLDPAPDYLASYVPRVPGLPHTAPRYDDVTKPAQAPYPAACIAMGSKCKCYTQQGTLLPTTQDICRQVVAGGFFMEWNPSNATGGGGGSVAASEPRKPIEGAPGSSPAVHVPQTLPELPTGQAARDGRSLAMMLASSRTASGL